MINPGCSCCGDGLQGARGGLVSYGCRALQPKHNGYLRRGYHQATNVTSYRTIAMRPCFLAALLLAMAVLCLTQAASHLQCTGSTVDVALGASYGVIITVVPDRCACCEGLLCNGH